MKKEYIILYYTNDESKKEIILNHISSISGINIIHKYNTIDAVKVSIPEEYNAVDISTYIAAHFSGDVRIIAIQLTNDVYFAISSLMNPIKSKLKENFTIDDIKNIHIQNKLDMEELLLNLASVINKTHDTTNLKY